MYWTSTKPGKRYSAKLVFAVSYFHPWHTNINQNHHRETRIHVNLLISRRMLLHTSDKKKVGYLICHKLDTVHAQIASEQQNCKVPVCHIIAVLKYKPTHILNILFPCMTCNPKWTTAVSFIARIDWLSEFLNEISIFSSHYFQWVMYTVKEPQYVGGLWRGLKSFVRCLSTTNTEALRRVMIVLPPTWMRQILHPVQKYAHWRKEKYSIPKSQLAKKYKNVRNTSNSKLHKIRN